MDAKIIWDSLSDEFNTYKKNLFAGAADNIYIVWPIILSYAKKNIKGDSLLALDYGCGTGMFCRKLNSNGFNAAGIDISPNMIKIAKKRNGKNLYFSVGGYKTAYRLSRKLGKFSLISAIMVFQFVPDIKNCIKRLSDCLADEGHIIFAVHNPKKLEERKIKNKFEIGKTGKITKIYKRTAEQYDKIFKNLGFKKKFEKYPRTSKKFLQEYKQEYSAKIPKYMVLGYKKI